MRKLSALIIAAILCIGALPALAATVVVTVNDASITDTQVSARQGLFRLEGRSPAQKEIINELVNEALMLQEAERIGVKVTQEQIDGAFTNVARQIKVSPSNLREILAQNGVAVSTMHDRLRAAIAWQGVVGQVVQSRVQISDADLDKQAALKVTEANSFDYILKEVVFLMPGGKGSASRRTSEANAFRKAYAGCDSAVPLSLKYTDAAVIDVGRRHATQLPDAVAKELAGMRVGGITKPRVNDSGVSMLAVCSKDAARDLTFIKNGIRQQTGDQLLKGEIDKYLAELRSKARIVVR